MSETPVQNVGEGAVSGFGEPMPGDMPDLPPSEEEVAAPDPEPKSDE